MIAGVAYHLLCRYFPVLLDVPEAECAVQPPVSPRDRRYHGTTNLAVDVIACDRLR